MNDEWRSSQFDSPEAEPLGPLANLVDIMLVFSCGLIAALVAVSPDLEKHFDINTQQKLPTNMQTVTSVGKELSAPPETLQKKIQSQSGYQSMGQVYRDPETGKLILISND
ncbi:hypothetical protein GCM10007916_13820 [Psychromonas marina]|uniref:DUF2149 domain-containing protein n=1 Tax=Psychromonas marina TaxID=88364 RepID=A0ABQ6DZE6_9GAMM|nr:DUF2149 domain-containing protein [Psychromonas marina]GLS90315.1 hypothetical protein GCM10007916_13820 [Psychromonas marina]